jgi:hypothetical protein
MNINHNLRPSRKGSINNRVPDEMGYVKKYHIKSIVDWMPGIEIWL